MAYFFGGNKPWQNCLNRPFAIFQMHSESSPVGQTWLMSSSIKGWVLLTQHGDESLYHHLVVYHTNMHSRKSSLWLSISFSHINLTRMSFIFWKGIPLWEIFFFQITLTCRNRVIIYYTRSQGQQWSPTYVIWWLIRYNCK